MEYGLLGRSLGHGLDAVSMDAVAERAALTKAAARKRPRHIDDSESDCESHQAVASTGSFAILWVSVTSNNRGSVREPALFNP